MFTTLPRQTRLASCLAAVLVVAPAAQAATRTVTNCSDSDAGSLRSAIASASASGDTIVFDTAQMACSTITLTSGQISIGSQELTIQGPVASTLTIDGSHSSRVFLDTGFYRKLTINNLTIANGTTHSAAPNSLVAGGCILVNGYLVLTASTVSGCVVSNDATSGTGSAAGGGIAAYRMHVQNSVVSSNAAYGHDRAGGGGIYLGGQALIEASTVSGNRAQAATILGWATGGGITSQVVSASNGAVQIVSSVINKNEADDGGGVAIVVYGDYWNVSIDHSTISGNRSRVTGGGLYIVDGSSTSTATIVNSTISGNRSYGTIGGVFSDANLRVRNSTIAFNRADSGISSGRAQAAGLYSWRSAILQSSIVANNTVGVGYGSDMNGPTPTSMVGYDNLIMTTLAGTTAPPGTLTADPLLGPLANNGGPTLTRALLAGSPAISAGNNLAQLAYDQRGPGFPRSFGGKTDIGAFQTNDGIFYDGFD